MDDLLKTLLGMGPGGLLAAFMFYQWREERSERRALQEKQAQLLETTISSRHELASALEKLADKIGA